MKSYLIVTSVIYALLMLSHVARLVAEGFWRLREPIFVITTLLSAVMFIWSLRLMKRPS